MATLTRGSLYSVLHSRNTYIFLACIVLFYALIVITPHQHTFSDAQEAWERMDPMEQQFSLAVLGYENEAQVIAYFQETYFSNALHPSIWLILCAVFSLMLFPAQKKAKHLHAALFTGHRRGSAVLSHYLLYIIVVLPFAFVLTLGIELIFNSSWISLASAYILRCYAMLILMLLHYGAVFTSVMLCMRSTAAATVTIVGLSSSSVLIANLRSNQLDAIFGVLFPFTRSRELNIWAVTLTPSLRIHAIGTMVYAALSTVVLCAVTCAVLRRRDLT